MQTHTSFPFDLSLKRIRLCLAKEGGMAPIKANLSHAIRRVPLSAAPFHLLMTQMDVVHSRAAGLHCQPALYVVLLYCHFSGI